MRTIIKYNRLFIFNENFTKSFLAEFKDGINIIYGANTSGKSTVIQAINYTFGINDEKYKLADILSEKPIFRLDFSVSQNKEKKLCTIIREDDFIFIKVDNKPVVKFEGVSSNNSSEHTKLKEFLSELFCFRLKLNSKGHETNAPLEAMFLPYYVAQDYGWILPLKSFKNFDYYKGFKESYYDYYFGIIDPLEDKTEKYKLEEEKKIINSEIDILERIKHNNKDLIFAQNNDELFIRKAIDYVEKYNDNRKSILQKERRHIVIANQLRYNEERLAVLRDTQINLKENNLFLKRCPVCNNEINYSLADKYTYFQNCEDTSNLIKTIKQEIIYLKSKLSSNKKEIEKIRAELEKNYSVLGSYKIKELSMNEWLKNKACIQVIETIKDKEEELNIRLEEIISKLKLYKTDKNIEEGRRIKCRDFNKVFKQYLRELNVKSLDEDISPYRLSVFPQQGVELLKTVLAYHFAINRVINRTDNIHKLPLCLDAIFKEDVDYSNKKLIVSFISRNLPEGTQLICSMAESTDGELRTKNYVRDFNSTYFNDTANLIKTGDKARSLMYSCIQKSIIMDSISIMYE